MLISIKSINISWIFK